MQLSIVVCALSDRRKSLAALLERLYSQERSREVEVLVACDGGESSISDKRNRLVHAATGDYIAHIDDDDLVSERYIPSVLDAIDTHPGVDVVLLRGERVTSGYTHVGKPVVQERRLFDYCVGAPDGGETIDGVLWRSPGHLCPMRSEIAKIIPFPPLPGTGEDLAWGKEVAPLLKTSARAGRFPGDVLYFYQYTPNKKTVATERKVTAKTGGRPHTPIFTPQYKDNSGPGSTPQFSAPYRAFLEKFIEEKAITSVVDLGCGDMQIMSRTNLFGASYLGIDCIEERIRKNRGQWPHLQFAVAEFNTIEIPEADLILCKDVLQHWNTFEVKVWLERLLGARDMFRYALLTNCAYGETLNKDTLSGEWRAIDLTAPPFSVGEKVFSWGKPNKDVVLVEGTRNLFGAVP